MNTTDNITNLQDEIMRQYQTLSDEQALKIAFYWLGFEFLDHYFEESVYAHEEETQLKDLLLKIEQLKQIDTVRKKFTKRK